jgi:NTP pyrophosphatase (non-canonical NTP hydrolase)
MRDCDGAHRRSEEVALQEFLSSHDTSQGCTYCSCLSHQENQTLQSILVSLAYGTEQKDLALAVNVEAAELLELFLWKDASEADINKVKEELADVFAYAFLLAEKYNLNVRDIVLDKIKRNAEKYPVDKAKGTAKKYNEL